MLFAALIDPRRHWQAYRALGRLLHQRRELAWELTKHEISERYAGQVFGTLWAIGHPLIMVAIYVVVFGRIFGGSAPPEPGRLDQTTFLLGGLVPWVIMAELLGKACALITGNAGMVKQLVFPIEVLPIKGAMASMISLCVAIGVVVLYALLANGRLPWSMEDHRTLRRTYRLQIFAPHPLHQQEYELRSVAAYITQAYVPDHMRHFFKLLHREIVCTPAPCPHELERDYTLPAPGQDDHIKLCSPSPGLRFWATYRWTSPPAIKPWTYSPLSFIGFEPFEIIGFAFWSAERLCASSFLLPDDPEVHRLSRGNHSDGSRDHEVFYTWQSILSPEELHVLEHKSRGHTDVFR